MTKQKIGKKVTIYLNLRIPAEWNLAVMTQREGLEEEKEDGEEETREEHKPTTCQQSHGQGGEGKQSNKT